ncbi:MAG: radical SAM protein [Nannocystaceae bacterium]
MDGPQREPWADATPLRAVSLCLVRPPAVTAPRSLSYYGAVPELGLAYVAAAARQAGHRVQVVDGPGEALDHGWPLVTAAGVLRAHGLPPAAIVARIAPGTEVIGVANMFLHEWPTTRALLEAIRVAHPRALLIAGGENASAMAHELLAQCAALDAVVRGEGERPIVALLAQVAAGAPLGELPGVVRRGGRQRPAPRIERIDALPWPAWDLFPIAHYLSHGSRGGVDRGPSMPLLTSRGCPYRCSFCSSPTMWGTRYVRRDPAGVLDEIADLQRRYGITNVDLHDLTAMLTKAWIVEFCDAIAQRGLRFTWQLPSGTRSEAIDEAVARRMVAAGCRNFCYAPESGSPAELARMRKRVVPERLLRSLRGAIAAGMVTHASIIIGMPEQTAADVRATAGFIAKMAWAGLHTLSVMVFSPYPGSEAYAQALSRGQLVRDEAWIYGSLLRSRGGGRNTRGVHPRWSPRRLLALQLGLLVGFFAISWARHPRRAPASLLAVLRGRQDTVLEQLAATKLTAARAWARERFTAVLRSLRPAS